MLEGLCKHECENGITKHCFEPCFDNNVDCVVNCGKGLVGREGICVDECVLKTPNRYTGLCEGTCVANLNKFENIIIIYENNKFIYLCLILFLIIFEMSIRV
jgi:hypothetical protein